LIFEEFLEKKTIKEIWGFRTLNIQSFKKNPADARRLECPIKYCLLISYTYFWTCRKGGLEGVKVIHTVKNLFCNVALICNLVQEFNGLVSKGLAI